MFTWLSFGFDTVRSRRKTQGLSQEHHLVGPMNQQNVDISCNMYIILYIHTYIFAYIHTLTHSYMYHMIILKFRSMRTIQTQGFFEPPFIGCPEHGWSTVNQDDIGMTSASFYSSWPENFKLLFIIHSHTSLPAIFSQCDWIASFYRFHEFSWFYSRFHDVWYLVGGLEHFFNFPYIGNVVIPIDYIIFFRGVGLKPPARYDRLSIDYP